MVPCGAVVPNMWCQMCGANMCGAKCVVPLGTAWYGLDFLDWLGLAFGQDFP